MKTRKAWTVYIVLRLAFFAVPFAALMLIGWPWWLAAVTATLAAVSLSVIFLAKPRETAAESIHDWRERSRTADDIAEDDAIEASGAAAATDLVRENAAGDPGASGEAIATGDPIAATTDAYDRIVVGGGAMGLAAAWQLAKRGRRVLLLEQFQPGHTEGASHGATRNLNNAYSEAHYLDLFEEAFGLYRELEEASGEQLLTLCGLVTHGVPEQVRAAHASLAARGAEVELIDASEASARWPGMRFDGPVLIGRDAGRVHAATTLSVLASEAAKHGAELRWGHRVTGIEVLGDDRVAVEARTPEGEAVRFEAAGAVVAAGAWSNDLLRTLPGFDSLPPLRVTEEHPAHFAVRPSVDAAALTAWPSFNHVLPPETHGEHTANVYGMLTPGEGVKVGYHLVGREVDPDARPHHVPGEAQAALKQYVAEWFPGLDPESAEWVSCTYTTTPSQRFVLDRVGPITVGAGFSGQGFKFVPAVGRVLADASTGGPLPAPEWRLAAHQS